MTDRAAIATLVVSALTTSQPTMQIGADPNAPFTPPSAGLYAQVRFVEGAQIDRSVGVHRLVVVPTLVYVDVHTPLGSGDGLATQLGDVVRDALRDQVVGATRWKRFAGGTEGKTDTHYRYQVVALFWRERRV